jgi:hypothetical protein
MTSFTLPVSDPDTGERFYVTAYMRSGRLIIQRLGRHLFEPGVSESRAAVLEKFRAVAGSARGARRTGALPPAAQAVKEAFEGHGRASRAGRGKTRSDHHGYYVSLLGVDEVRQLEQALLTASNTDHSIGQSEICPRPAGRPPRRGNPRQGSFDI